MEGAKASSRPNRINAKVAHLDVSKSKSLPSISGFSKKRRKKKIKKTSVSQLMKQSTAFESETMSVSTDRLHITMKYDDLSVHNNSSDDDLSSTFSLTSISHYEPLSLTDNHSLDSRYSRSSSHFSGNKSLSGISLSSETSQYSHYSSHDLVAKISRHIDKHLPPPDYVPSLLSLPPNYLSWNKKVKKGFDPANPPINIAACMQPLEVILAKADHRLRRQAKVNKIRKREVDSKMKALEKAIHEKRSRAERIAAELEQRQREGGWLRIVFFVAYISKLSKQFESKKGNEHSFTSIITSAMIIHRFFYNWYLRKLRMTVQEKYACAFGKIETTFRLFLRIYRRRKATARIRSFLESYKGQHRVNIMTQIHQLIFFPALTVLTLNIPIML